MSELITISEQVNQTAQELIKSGHTIEINEIKPYVCINTFNGEEVEFNGEDAENLISEAKESAIFEEGYCTLEAVILFLCQGYLNDKLSIGDIVEYRPDEIWIEGEIKGTLKLEDKLYYEVCYLYKPNIHNFVTRENIRIPE